MLDTLYILYTLCFLRYARIVMFLDFFKSFFQPNTFGLHMSFWGRIPIANKKLYLIILVSGFPLSIGFMKISTKSARANQMGLENWIQCVILTLESYIQRKGVHFIR